MYQERVTKCGMTYYLVHSFVLKVAVLSNCSDDLTERAFEYGRNIGMAFQVIELLMQSVHVIHVTGDNFLLIKYLQIKYLGS